MTLPLVLLPGMMCDARLFGPQIAALSRTVPVMTCPLTAHNTVRALARDVLAAAPARFALAGLSMGGIVAMEVARQAPGRVDRIALLDTNPLAETPDRAAAREPQIAKVRAGRLLEVIRDEMKPNYLAAGTPPPELLETVIAMAEDLGPDVFIRQSRALQSRPDQQVTLRKLGIPALVLCGAEDKLCPVRVHELMAGLIAESELVVLPGAGHLPTLEVPELVTAALGQWLAHRPGG